MVPPSMEELGKRLRQRHTESPSDLATRLKTAEEEMQHLSLFDYMVVNPVDGIEQADHEFFAEPLRQAERLPFVHDLVPA